MEDILTVTHEAGAMVTAADLVSIAAVVDFVWVAGFVWVADIEAARKVAVLAVVGWAVAVVCLESSLLPSDPARVADLLFSFRILHRILCFR